MIRRFSMTAGTLISVFAVALQAAARSDDLAEQARQHRRAAEEHFAKQRVDPPWQAEALVLAPRPGEAADSREGLKPNGLVARMPAQSGESRHLGRLAKWAKLEIVLTGPASKARGEPNPFAVVLDVDFTAPSGKRYRVPGFYDGDGRGGADGNVWKVRFSADETGKWSVRTKSGERRLNGHAGTFEVTAPGKNATGFWKWGRLESVGTAKNRIRYLKFRDGPYWLKAGCDDPENFLGNYRNYDTLAKRKAAVDYLADHGINSLYVMTHNLGGDDNDVWPWLGGTPREAKANGGKDARFDVARLKEWRVLFEWMQSKGVVPYLVLEDDSAWKGYDHARYYREMVARFGYLPALLFNFNEEHNENYRLAEALEHVKQLRDPDPYDHPRGIHNVNRPNDEYVDAAQVDFTSIQTKTRDPLMHNKLAIDWIGRCESRGKRILMVNFDEGRPEADRRAWWSAYLGGGVWEAHVRAPYDRPMSTWTKTWKELGGTRAFMESLPFWEMEPHNELVRDGKAFCLAKPGEAYALYRPLGGTVTVRLAPEATYQAAWWKPTNGQDGTFQNREELKGGVQRLAPPGKGDWALRIVRKQKENKRGGSDYFPPPESKGGWRKLTDPEDVRKLAGMDPAKLAELKKWLLKSDKRNFAAVVIRRGYVVLEVERGNSAKTDARRVASVSKAICATVLAIASERSRQGRTPRKMKFDDPAFQFIPQAKPLSDPRKAKITVKQLLNHTSGICPEATGASNRGTWKYVLGHSGDKRTAKLAFDPGTACGYSTHALHHASLVCENVTGMPYDQFAVRALFKPIGCEKWWFQYFEGGTKEIGRHPSHAMGMPARDLARIAYCMLRDGRWRDQQVIPKWFVDETAKPTHSVKTPELRFKINAQTFSHGWELPALRSKEAARGIPKDARFKPGSGGQLIAFVPSLDLVIARQTGGSGAWHYDEYLRRACQAVAPPHGRK